MSIPYKLGLFLLLVLINFSSQAAVFKCSENGNITFSDKPCKSNEQDLSHQKLTIPPAKKTPPEKSELARIKSMSSKMEASRIKVDLERSIKSLVSEKEEIEKARDAELLILKQEKISIGEAGDYDDELSFIELINNINDKISKTKTRYAAELSVVNNKLNALYNKQKKLQ